MVHLPKFMKTIIHSKMWMKNQKSKDICQGRRMKGNSGQFSLLTCCVLFRAVATMVNARQEIISANISGDLVG